MIKYTKILFLAIVSLLLMFSVGCQSVPATGGAYEKRDAVFRFGELVVSQENAFEDFYGATLAALEAQELFVTERTKNSTEAIISARDRADRRITIKLKRTGRQITSIKIRYGLPGDRHLAQALFAAIDRTLGERI